MTSKLKCPFCGEELDWCLSCPLPTMSCPNHNCKAYDFLMTQICWQELIKTRQDLEQSEKCCSAWETQALDYKAETIALSGKLEIATKALGWIAELALAHDDISIADEVVGVFDALNQQDFADKIREQIDHIADVSKMVEHKDEK